MRNHYAKALRVKPQQIISDKREKTYREVLNETAQADISEFDALLDRLK